MTGMRWVTAAAFALATLGCGVGSEPVDSGRGGDASIRMDAEVTVCERDRDCADELFCNGDERCMPGAEGADARGCVSGAPACEVACDEARDVCSGCDTDGDEDGEIATSCGGTDCDDADPAVRSGADELCDDEGLDEDCNPETIQSELEDGDVDGDGHIATRCFNVRAGGTETRGDDCDDAVAGVHPGAADGCGGGDEDCDGEIDEDVEQFWYLDGDGDGWGDAAVAVRACFPPARHVTLSGDCDDSDRDVSPDASEECNGRDDDCDGGVDEAGRTFCRDDDGDGFGASGDCVDVCAGPSGFVENDLDCNDADPVVYGNSIAWIAEPFCTTGRPCTTATGWDCSASAPLPDGSCAAGSTSVATPSWDTNCDRITQSPPVGLIADGACSRDGLACCSWDGASCANQGGVPVVQAAHSAADCGLDAELWSCTGTSAETCPAPTSVIARLPCQ